MGQLQFIVPCVPVAQPRQRQRVIEVSGRAFASNYTPAKHPVNAFKAACQRAASEAIERYEGFELLDCPLWLYVVFVLPRPAKVPKKSGLGRIAHCGKPDLDNLTKSVLDSLEGIVFRNDSMICSYTVHKFKAAQGESCKVEVKIIWHDGERG